MENQERYTLRDVYRDYMVNKFREELHGEWAAVVFYRGPAILLTPLLVNHAVKPTTVTCFSVAVVLVMPLTLFLPLLQASLCLALLGILFNILDCVDGNIARVTGSRSRTGQYTDFIADILHRIFLYLTLGLLLQAGMANAGATVLTPFQLMVFASLLAVVARLSREYAMAAFATAGAEERHGNITAEPGRLSMIQISERLVFSFISGLDTLTPVLILVSALFASLNWLPWWLLFYSLLDFSYTQFAVIRKIR